jgi:hypothetical protein
MGAAVAIGFFPALSAHAVNPYSVWDAVPGDLVASAILGTAAAVAAGLQSEIVAATGCGAWEGPEGAPAAASRAAAAAGGLSAVLKAAASKVGATASGLSDAASSLIGVGSGGPIQTASESETVTSSDDESRPGSPSARVPPTSAPPPSPAPRGPAPRRAPGGGRPPLMIVHAATSTTYPSIVYEAYNATVDFLKAFGAPTSILVGGARWLPYMPPTWRPSPRMVEFWKVYNRIKVEAVCFLLRCDARAAAARQGLGRRSLVGLSPQGAPAPTGRSPLQSVRQAAASHQG